MDSKKDKQNLAYFNYRTIKNFLESLFQKAGLTNNDANLLADSLVASNLRGYDSHGVLRTDHYLTRLSNKSTKVRPSIKLDKLSDAAIVVDGDHGIGQVVSFRSMIEAIELASAFGIGCAVTINSNHFGRASYYTQQAVDKGMIGIAMTHTDANTVPYGGLKPYFGTNVLAFSAPSNETYPIVIDFSMSAISFGKVYEAALFGDKLPQNTALDDNGKMTIDPRKAANLYPASGYKGYALSMMIEILCSILVGSPFGHHIVDMYNEIDKPRALGHFFIAIDIKKFRELNDFKRDISRMIGDLQAIPLHEGFDSVKIPGQIEYETFLQRRANGIPLPQDLVYQLKSLAMQYKVDFPSSIRT